MFYGKKYINILYEGKKVFIDIDKTYDDPKIELFREKIVGLKKDEDIMNVAIKILYEGKSEVKERLCPTCAKMTKCKKVTQEDKKVLLRFKNKEKNNYPYINSCLQIVYVDSDKKDKYDKLKEEYDELRGNFDVDPKKLETLSLALDQNSNYVDVDKFVVYKCDDYLNDIQARKAEKKVKKKILKKNKTEENELVKEFQENLKKFLGE